MYVLSQQPDLLRRLQRPRRDPRDQPRAAAARRCAAARRPRRRQNNPHAPLAARGDDKISLTLLRSSLPATSSAPRATATSV
eukprot:4386327-Prymnesium_polylepis.1